MVVGGSEGRAGQPVLPGQHSSWHRAAGGRFLQAFLAWLTPPPLGRESLGIPVPTLLTSLPLPAAPMTASLMIPLHPPGPDPQSCPALTTQWTSNAALTSALGTTPAQR